MLKDNTIELTLRSVEHPTKTKKLLSFDTVRPVDRATFIYIVVIALILSLFHRGVPYWQLIVPGHFIAIGLLFLFIQFADKHPNKLLTILRDWYPFLLYTFLFKEINLMMNAVFPFWLEPWLIKVDRLIFGIHPVVFLQRFYRPWLTEIMAFSYWSYYIMLPLTGVVFYLRKNKRSFHSFIFHLSITLYVCYFSYPFLTARGPHETLAYLYPKRAAVGFFDHFVQVIQNQASISGAAFPSSHVAAVWVVLFFVLRQRRKIGLLLLPLIIALSVSVVYMQYHYVLDPVAGIGLVCLSYPVATFLERRLSKQFLTV